MTKNTTKEKAPPLRKAKKGAWWKRLTPDPEPQETIPPLPALDPVAEVESTIETLSGTEVPGMEPAEVQIKTEDSMPVVAVSTAVPPDPETPASYNFV